MKKEKEELSLEQEITLDCPILYRMRYRPMSETCMCWGFECGKGWLENIQEASYALETLNRMFYPKYRVRIQADQVKEKFGELRYYYSVVVDHGKILEFILSNLEKAVDYCMHHDFKCKTIVDVAPFDYDDIRILSKEDYDRKSIDKHKCSNVDYVEENGTYKEVVHLRNYGKSHPVPTKCKIWWKFGRILNNVKHSIDYFFDKPNNSDTRRIINFMNAKAEEIVRKAEDKCSKTCELCGYQIGTDWSPVCQTTGWISYICGICAKKQDGTYYMNDNLMQKGKVIKSKEQIIEELKNKKDKKDAED